MNRRARVMGRRGGVVMALVVLAAPAGTAVGDSSPLPSGAVTPTPTAAVTIVAAPTTVPPDPAATPAAPAAAATPVATPAPSDPTPAPTPDASPTPAPTPVVTPTAIPTSAPAAPRLPAASTAQTSPGPESQTAPEDVPAAQSCGDAGPNCGIVDAACSILGTPGNDVLVGSPLDDVICGLAGNDVIEGNGGDDVLVGGTGDDTLVGGPGEDCLLAGPGADTIKRAAPNEPVAGDPAEANPDARVTPQGTCYRVVVLAGSTGAQEVLQLVVRHAAAAPGPASPGPLAGPARTGAFFIAIARLAAAVHVGATSRPVALPRSAVVRDGQIRQLLLCPDRVSGTLVYRRHGRRVAGGRFTCTPPSEVVRIRLSRAARSRLERRPHLEVWVRATLGPATYRFQVLLKAAEAG